LVRNFTTWGNQLEHLLASSIIFILTFQAFRVAAYPGHSLTQLLQSSLHFELLIGCGVISNFALVKTEVSLIVLTNKNYFNNIYIELLLIL